MSDEETPAAPADDLTDDSTDGKSDDKPDETVQTSGEDAPSVEMSSPVATRVFELLAPVVATADVELLDVEWTGGTLRVVLDRPDGVTTEQLTSVNRLISPILDQHDPVPGRYTLEVSSPGVERPLRRLEHFRRAIGEEIIVKTIATVEPRRVKGSLTSVAEHSVTIDVIEVDGVDLTEPESRELALADVSTARTVFDWGPTPKLGGKHNQNKGNQSKGGKKKPGGKAAKNQQGKTSSGGSPKNASKKKSSGKQPNPQKNRNEVGDE